jgi:hypothetical protein
MKFIRDTPPFFVFDLCFQFRYFRLACDYFGLMIAWGCPDWTRPLISTYGLYFEWKKNPDTSVGQMMFLKYKTFFWKEKPIA